MRSRNNQRLLAWLLTFVIASSGVEPAGVASAKHGEIESAKLCTSHTGSGLFARTELFFGRAKPDGTIINDEEFRRFLDQVITPRFPNGLTALSATGQFRGSSGMVTHEGAVFVILLYPTDDEGSSARIEEIRKAYKRAFQQESVLRVDSQSCVSF
jgi:hypothetical protein